jgi:Uma2 family endonuclease
MTVAAAEKHYTPEDLLALPDGEHYELVDGELVEKDIGTEAGWIAGQILKRLAIFIDAAGLGWVMTSDASYRCFPAHPQRVRRPDVSFIRRGRLAGERIPKGHTPIPPDLAVEVVSPNDFYSDVRAKVEEYLCAGVPAVWTVDPKTRTIEVLRSDGSVSHLHEEDDLTGDDVLPGFRCRVADLFPPAPEAVPET